MSPNLQCHLNSLNYWSLSLHRQIHLWKHFEVWEGEIDNKLPNGFGTYTHTNGTIYVGQYVDGLREGQGTWTLFNGKKFVGIWKENQRWKGKSFDEESKEIGEYVNGEEEIYFKPSF